MREFTTADRLKELLEVKRISQAGLSKIMGISRSAMCQYISGKNHPETRQIIHYQHVLRRIIGMAYGL